MATLLDAIDAEICLQQLWYRVDIQDAHSANTTSATIALSCNNNNQLPISVQLSRQITQPAVSLRVSAMRRWLADVMVVPVLLMKKMLVLCSRVRRESSFSLALIKVLPMLVETGSERRTARSKQSSISLRKIWRPTWTVSLTGNGSRKTTQIWSEITLVIFTGHVSNIQV